MTLKKATPAAIIKAGASEALSAFASQGAPEQG
jgi:hypothetical protein